MEWLLFCKEVLILFVHLWGSTYKPQNYTYENENVLHMIYGRIHNTQATMSADTSNKENSFKTD